MFSFRDSREAGVRVDVAFTDATLDLLGPRGTDGLPTAARDVAAVERACGVRFARLRQVHGDDVVVVEEPTAPQEPGAVADAVVTGRRGLGLMVRVADCVPVLLADTEAGLVGAVHAGRHGMVLGVTTRAVERMRAAGASELVAWIGPRVCAACYEVPEEMRAEAAAVVPAAYAVSRDGTPALDVGAGVRAQLEAAGVEVVDVDRCTREDPALHSYRRDGAAAGRLGGLVWMS